MSEITLQEALTMVLQMAQETVPERGHKGSCTPETSCDTDCMNAYYSTSRGDVRPVGSGLSG